MLPFTIIFRLIALMSQKPRYLSVIPITPWYCGVYLYIIIT